MTPTTWFRLITCTLEIGLSSAAFSTVALSIVSWANEFEVIIRMRLNFSISLSLLFLKSLGDQSLWLLDRINI